MNPLLSIIIPVYNAERYLRQCLDSVLAQTYPDWECILVDDGSKDSSGDICDEYAQKDSRFKVYHKENGGVSSARNRGLEDATGDWIAFIDSDDYVSPDFLQNFMDLPQDVDLLQQGFYSVGAWWGMPAIEEIAIKMNDCVASHPQNILPFINEMMDNDMHAYIWCKLFSNEIIKKYSIRFNEEINYQEDFLFAFDYYRHINSAANSSKLGYYYIFPQNGKKYGKVNALMVYKLCMENMMGHSAEHATTDHLKENFLKRFRHYYLKPGSFSGIKDFCVFFSWFGKTYSRKNLHKVLGNLRQEKLIKALYWGNPILSIVAFSITFVMTNVRRISRI